MLNAYVLCVFPCEEARIYVVSLSQSLFFFFFNSLNWTASLLILLELSGQWTLEILLSQHWDFRHMPPRMAFYIGAGNPSSCPHISASSTNWAILSDPLHTILKRKSLWLPNAKCLKSSAVPKSRITTKTISLLLNIQMKNTFIPCQSYWNSSITLDCEQRYLIGFKPSVFQILTNSDIMTLCIYIFLHSLYLIC